MPLGSVCCCWRCPQWVPTPRADGSQGSLQPGGGLWGGDSVPRAAVPLQVGFLKILHRYEITFLLPPSQRLGKDVCALPLPNPNLKVLTVAAVPEGKAPPSPPPPLCVHPTTPKALLRPLCPICGHGVTPGVTPSRRWGWRTAVGPPPTAPTDRTPPQCHLSVVFPPPIQATA